MRHDASIPKSHHRVNRCLQLGSRRDVTHPLSPPIGSVQVEAACLRGPGKWMFRLLGINGAYTVTVRLPARGD